MNRMVPGLACAALAIAWSVSVRAQLISDEVRGDQRVCTYFGSDTLPNDEVVARTISVGLGQSCPATAPHHDPNAPIPPNARLIRETTAGTNRICIYEQGGVQYQMPLSLQRNCAMTPALNAAAQP